VCVAAAVANAEFQYVADLSLSLILLFVLLFVLLLLPAEEQKQEFVNSNPHTTTRNAFKYDPATRQVRPHC
jgi:hypothetical protein